MFGKIQVKLSLECSVDEETGVMLLNIKKKNLQIQDFDFIEKVIADYFEKYGPFKGIIINSKKLPYWKGPQNKIEYIGFVSNNHHKFEKVALAINGFFVRLLPAIARGKISPVVKHFGYNKIEKADEWILH